MRFLAAALLLAGCFGPAIGDGSFLCVDGLECPEGMFCNRACSPARCFISPSAVCPADAGGVADSPLSPFDAPFSSIDSPLVQDAPPGTPDAPVIRFPDGPPVIIIDAPVIHFPDGPKIIDAPKPPLGCDGPMVISDGGISACTVGN